MSIIEKAIAKLNTTTNSTKSTEDRSVQQKTPDARSEYSKLQLKFNIETLSAAGIVSPNEQAPYLADEFRRIKRPLLNNAFGASSELVSNGNIIMVTSSLPGEGKSFTAVNLALSIALEKDYTVLLIDADVAMSKITRMFSLEKYDGMTDKLEKPDMDIADLIIKSDFPGLSIMPAGKHTTMATELIASGAMKDLIQEIGQRYSNRIIIFDSPPLLATSEATVLAEQVGQIVVVVEANKTPQSAVMDSIGLLKKDKAIGLVLNKASKGHGYSKYGYYGTYGR